MFLVVARGSRHRVSRRLSCLTRLVDDMLLSSPVLNRRRFRFNRALYLAGEARQRLKVMVSVAVNRTASGKIPSVMMVDCGGRCLDDFACRMMWNVVVCKTSPVGSYTSDWATLTSSAESNQSDGRDLSGYGKKAWRKQQKAIRRYADINKQTQLSQQLIPRTERAPKDRNLAEKEPEKFAAMLREKLLKVKEEQEKLERIKENLQNLESPRSRYVSDGDVSTASHLPNRSFHLIPPV
ncbi:hypothetical protein LSH36_472g02015 [Paralvinella palmiformis]|uniref:Uncharacterized protein n=1 Tax=Paralvinella palmiformis TaxID=53620 RepID=A0AAD9J9J0_9ANNE|nr:hypothetical protein LSH36_472g02015 [Paralvinella palmiformis]